MVSARRAVAAVVLTTMAAVGSGCVGHIRRVLLEPERASLLDRNSPYLKAHMQDGGVYILSKWSADEAERVVTGEGQLLGPDRRVVQDGVHTFSLDAVALFETNVVKQSLSVTGLAIITGISATVTAYCASDPKACFGSCPTFYVSDGTRPILQAEGFSASVAPSLEAVDVDALYRARPSGREVEIRMTNEALETHFVRHVHLLAVPREPTQRVFVTPNGRYLETWGAVGPSSCIGPEGDCLESLGELDGRERVSSSDGKNLAAREVVELEFVPRGEGPYGLVVASRQTLLTTYLFYQTLAYMGRATTGLLACMERGEHQLRKRARTLDRHLGGIEVFVKKSGRGWRRVDELRETGPLASDVKIVTLPRSPSGGRVKVRLRMARGHWRIDHVALVSITRPIEPLRLRPDRLRQVASTDVAGQGVSVPMAEPTFPLTTLPGDAYVFSFRLPGEPEGYELFLESRGYYLEWMRDEWLDEEDFDRLEMLFRHPQRALRVLAPEFKAREPRMEEMFWGSRFARP